MKTTIEIDGCEIVIEKEGDTITVSACKGGECMEEFSVECGGEEVSDDEEDTLPEGEEEGEEEGSEEEADFDEESEEEAEEDIEEPKLESFNSFVTKKNKKK